jgi:hypothetical protein
LKKDQLTTWSNTSRVNQEPMKDLSLSMANKGGVTEVFDYRIYEEQKEAAKRNYLLEPVF